MLPFLYVLFILSGAAGLFYESVWSRYLSLFVGHGAYAQVIVLVIFLGGMAIGAAAVSRFSDRLRDPLYGYAMVELGVGLLGLAFHDLAYLPVTGWAYDTLFPALGAGFPVVLAKWAIAGGLILPQSIFLGATFPLMSAGVLRRAPGRPGAVLSTLYFTNSLGAATGVLIAGFYLVNLAGLPGTLLAAAIINLVVGLAALVASKYGPAADAARQPLGPAAAPSGDADLFTPEALARLLLLAAAGTAVASFVYEVAWIRLLSLVLGSATHSFELMLSAFILGLSLGALWIRKRAEIIRRPLYVLVWVQVVMGVLAAGSLVLYQWSFEWTAALMAAIARTDQGYTLFTLARYAICLAIMLPATFCAGMTLPLITRTLLVSSSGERAIGTVYGANTLGSIAGAGLGSLVLIPVLGLKGTLVAGAALDIVVGVMIALSLLRRGAGGTRSALTGSAAVLAVVPLLVLVGVRLDQALLTSGVYRTGRADAAKGDSIFFYRDGRTATVSTARTANDRINIATNGKPDGSLTPVWLQACGATDSLRSLTGDDPTQFYLALLSLAHAPRARHAAVIGQGTGMSSHTLLASPGLEELTTIEIEPVMVEASRAFLPANRRVFEDPRSRFVYDDAKAHFAAANRRFDLIVAEPSNPWVSGVSGLFTSEFYGRVRRYLAPGGVLGQWIHTYELNDGLVLSVLGAIHQAFADYRIYAVNFSDLLIVATANGALPEPDLGVLELEGIQEDLCHFHPITRQDVAASYLTGRVALAPILDRVQQPNSDFYPVLDLGAERARFLGRTAAGIDGLSAGVYDFAGPLDTPPLVPGPQRVSSLHAISRIRALLNGAALRSTALDTAGFRLGPQDELHSLVRQWRAGLTGGPPSNWAVWTREFWTAFNAWHGGSRGWVDPEFIGPVRSFLARTAAPPATVATVEFRAGLAGRDWSAAASASDRLLAEARASRHWVDPDALREGAVMALLASGQPDSAQAVMTLLEPMIRRPADDIRTRLLDAYVTTAVESSGRSVGLQKP